MKVKIEALVVRNKVDMDIIDIIPIGDIYDEVSVEYPADMVTLDEIKTALKGFGELTRKDAYFNHLEGKSFTLSGEAKDVVSIGNVKVAIESKEVDWT